jgi:hypothetical protein
MSSDRGKRKTAAQVGAVLGTVFIIMGFAYGNQGLLIVGGIVLVIGIGARVSASTGRN